MFTYKVKKIETQQIEAGKTYKTPLVGDIEIIHCGHNMVQLLLLFRVCSTGKVYEYSVSDIDENDDSTLHLFDEYGNRHPLCLDLTDEFNIGAHYINGNVPGYYAFISVETDEVEYLTCKRGYFVNPCYGVALIEDDIMVLQEYTFDDSKCEYTKSDSLHLVSETKNINTDLMQQLGIEWVPDF